jgi:hypothetical protein
MKQKKKFHEKKKNIYSDYWALYHVFSLWLNENYNRDVNSHI